MMDWTSVKDRYVQQNRRESHGIDISGNYVPTYIRTYMTIDTQIHRYIYHYIEPLLSSFGMVAPIRHRGLPPLIWQGPWVLLQYGYLDYLCFIRVRLGPRPAAHLRSSKHRRASDFLSAVDEHPPRLPS